MDTGEPIIMCADYLFIKRVSEEKFSRLVVQECRSLSTLVFVFQDVLSHSNFSVIVFVVGTDIHLSSYRMVPRFK